MPKAEESPGEALLAWFEKNARDLPWRHTKDPYAVLVSEIMLQQTRAQTVERRFGRFLSRFPDAATLAAADEDEVLKEWEGLGYYRRARNLHAAAKYIADACGGIVPDTAEELRKVPGIGPYTAGAVSSIAFGRPETAVDANAGRVFSRVLALEVPADSREGRRQIEHGARQWLPSRAPGDFAQALMDLGSAVCTTSHPKCEKCPVRPWCSAAAAGNPEKYPVRRPKKERRVEARTALLFTAADRIALLRMPSGGLLAGMYGPPVPEGRMTEAMARDFAAEAGLAARSCSPGPQWRHVFTHVRWEMTSWILECAGEHKEDGFVWADEHDLYSEVAVPSAFRPLISAWQDMLRGRSCGKG